MERIRIAVVGLGFGGVIVNQLLKPPASDLLELIGVCDVDPERVRATTERTGLPAYLSLDDILADETVPALALITGPVGRAELIRKIIRAGKDVMTTKPFELDPDAALDVLREAESLGRTVHLNSPGPLMTANLRQIRDWEREFNLGRPVAYHQAYTCSYREKADGRWYDDPKLCPAAPIFRVGIYLINDMVRIMGEAESVQVTQSRVFTERPTADNALLTVLFRNGGIGNIFASFCIRDGQPGKHPLTINYENGTITQNLEPREKGKGGSGILNAVYSVDLPDGGFTTGIVQSTPVGVSGGYQWDAFYRSVKGEKLPDMIKPEEIVAGIRIIDAMARAAESGRSEKVRQ